MFSSQLKKKNYKYWWCYSNTEMTTLFRERFFIFIKDSFIPLCICLLLILGEFPFLCLLIGFFKPKPPPFGMEHLPCVKQDDHGGSSSKPHCWANQSNAFHRLFPFKTTSSKLTFLFSIIRWKALKYPEAISACTLFGFIRAFSPTSSILQLLYSLVKGG